MTRFEAQPDPLRDYASRYCDGTLSVEQTAELEARLRDDPEAMDFFVLYMELHSQIAWNVRSRGDSAKTDAAAGDISGGASPMSDNRSAPAISPTPFVVPYSSSPLFSPVSSILFSYGIATLIVGAGLLAAWVCKMPNDAEVAQSVVIRHDAAAPANASVVGCITGMVDCRWEGTGSRSHGSGESENNLPSPGHRPEGLSIWRGAGAEDGLHLHSPVHLADTLALRSGLAEITYETGAKVILQGPVTYRVDSAAGGYLAVGKLTARLEEKKATNPANPKSEIRNPKLFAVRTPTAVVTDLGTEFGVEVNKHGETISHVYRGTVQVRLVGDHAQPTNSTRILHANESVRVAEEQSPTSGNTGVLAMTQPTGTIAFVRKLPMPTAKFLNLVNLMAGGNGTAHDGNLAINPATGETAARPMKASATHNDYNGDGKYHRIAKSGVIDGVFIPNGGPGPVQIDSAGRTFSDFPSTANRTSDCFWLGGRYLSDDPRANDPATLAGVNYSQPGHNWIYLHANKGITIDLDAVRRMQPNCRLIRFHAIAGNSERVSAQGIEASADVWVLVDGQARFRRREINNFNGAFPISIPIGDGDRFLTFAATDGGNNNFHDWIIIGDPRLETASGRRATDNQASRTGNK